MKETYIRLILTALERMGERELRIVLMFVRNL